LRFSFLIRNTALLIVMLCFFYFPKPIFSLDTIHAKIHGQSYFLEIADTPQKRMQGLMFRTSLDDRGGLLFVFDTEQKYRFWMKNTPISLDIIWLSTEKRVVHIEQNTKPYSEAILYPKEKAKYVVELKAGQVQERNLKVGARVLFPQLRGNESVINL
jgi:uncharacterized protein